MPMLVKILVLVVVMILGLLACVRVWSLRHRFRKLDGRSLPGSMPDIGGREL